ncbi:MAG: DNRLRE domain-containing protein, partial [Opitutae bacterium]|nr:DNRLRE domain-containing protein [Opitutae bacterium]
AVAGEGRVSLDWPDSAGAASYTVYRSQSIDGPYLQSVQPQVSSYVDSRATPGQTYYYVVTATDSSGNESTFSNLVSAQPTGAHIAPQADAHVIGGVSANGNYGSNVELLCKTDGNADFTRESYLRFDLSGLSGTVGSAKLRLKVAATTGSGDTHAAYAVADDSWTESGIKWNNKPAAGSMIASATAPAVDAWIELDVSAQVAAELAGDQTFSTALVAAGTGLVRYHSKEAASSEDHPELLVTMATAPAPAAPTGVAAVVNGSEVELDWADSGAGVDFYGVYRSENTGGPYTHLLDTSETSYLQSPVAEDVTYYYVVTALDSDGNESAYSAEVSATRTSPISIQSLNPTDGLADLPPNLDLILTFSKAITRGSGSLHLVNLTDGGSTLIPVSDTAQVAIDGATLTINPSVNLLENRDYAVRIDAGAVEDVFGNAYGGIADDTTWNFSTTTMDASRVRNGDFADNATGFTQYPGYVGGSNPASVAEWIFSSNGVGNKGINGDGLSTPFSPSDRSAVTYFAFLQNGGTQFSQDLSGRLQAQRSYRISYLAASRAGNNSALGRLTVGDDTGTFYDSGQQQWSPAAFVSVSADFTTSASFDGPVLMTLSNESIAGDLSVAYSDVSIVQIPDYEVWEALYPAADLSDPDADYDGDGMSNGSERAWGLDPTSAASNQVVTAALDPGTDRFSYSRRDPAYHDLVYTIWTSTNLQAWTEDTAALQSAGATVNGAQEVTVTVSTPPVDGRLFVQVRAAASSTE